MISFHPVSIAFDAWRVTRSSPQLLAQRQHERLSELVAFARTHSRFYREKYRGLPETITDVRQLPPVTKTELMKHFDAVVTDPAVSRENIEIFLADKKKQLAADSSAAIWCGQLRARPALLALFSKTKIGMRS